MRELLINETWVNATAVGIVGESGVYETAYTKKGELFRELQKLYGRCVSKLYIERPNGKSRAIGWVFEKRQQYEDCPDTYMAECWVEIHKRLPKTSVKMYY
jgi:hypothetical protein